MKANTARSVILKNTCLGTVLLTALIWHGSISGQTPEWLNFTNGNEITAIAQENDTLWVGTACGLVKLNRLTGELIHVYDRINSMLQVMEITDIAIAQDGTKWIGTRQGLFRIRGSVWTLFNTEQGLPSSNISALTLDNSGLPVAGTLSSGLGFFSVTSNNFSSLTTATAPELPSDEILDLAFDIENNRLWIATYNGLAGKSASEWQVWDNTNGLPSNWITSVAVDTGGMPWAGTGQTGLARLLDEAQWQLFQVGNPQNSLFPSNTLRCVIVDGQNVPWVGTGDNGLAYFPYTINPDTNWIAFNSATSPEMPSNSVRVIDVDSQNNKWIGTSKGLVRLSGTLWTGNYTTSNSGLPDRIVRSVAARHLNSGLWVNTGNDVALFDGSAWQTYNASNSPLPNAPFSDIVVDGNDQLFVGTEGLGGYRFNGTSWEGSTTGSSDIPSNTILTSDVDIQNVLWIGTDNGLAKWSGTDWIPYNSQNTELTDNYIPGIKCDLTEIIWIASESFGLSQFNSTTFKVLPAPGGLTATYIEDMEVDGENNLWVATDMGLWMLKDQNWVSYTNDNSPLPTNFIRSLTFSPIGTLWIGTNQGLVQFAESDTAVYNTSNSGLIDNNVWDIQFDINGNLWIGTERGLAEFAVNETGDAHLLLSGSSISFGELLAGQSSDRYVRLINTGNADLTVGNIRISGPQASAFSLIRSVTQAIAPGYEDSTGVRFTPQTSGSFQADLIIESNAPSSPDTLSLTGSAGAAGFEWTPGSLDFGFVSPGDVNRRSLTITNTGSREMQITGSRIMGSSDFTIIQGGGIVTIQASVTHAMILEFAPLTPGIKDAALIVNHSAPTSPDTCLLTGSGGSPLLSLEPYLLNFGRVQIGTTQSQSVILTNQGTDTLRILDYYFYPQGSPFGILNSLPERLPPHHMAELTFTFSPSALLSYPALLILVSNSAAVYDTLNLLGNGVAFQINPDLLPGNISSDSSWILNLDIGHIITDKMFLYYKRPGQIIWDSTAFIRNGIRLSSEIEPVRIGSAGLSYYIASINTGGNKEYLSGDPDGIVNWLNTVTSSIQVPKISSPETYGLLSIPYYLIGQNIGQIFNDAFGHYNAKFWRLFTWTNENDTTAYYKEFNPAEAFWNIEPGQSFWLITRDSASFDMDHVQSVDSRFPYPIPLQKGWNQIGNPFTFPVAWDSVRVYNTTLEQRPVGRSGNAYVYNQTLLFPWEGYFVYSNGPGELRVPPAAATVSLPKTLKPGSYNPGELVLEVKAAGTLSHDAGIFNYLGMLHQASPSRDRLDWLKPPAIGDLLEVSIIQDGQKYAANYKPLSEEGASWEMEVTSLVSPELILLTLTPLTEWPGDYKIWLLDLDRGVPVPLDRNQYLISAPKRLRVIIGTESYAENQRGDIPLVQLEFKLRQNYPNPFNSNTNIEFHLTQRGPVRLEIFNVQGKKIRTLIHQDFPGGAFKAEWNGSDESGSPCPSGLYFFRLSASGFITVKKMMLLQ